MRLIDSEAFGEKLDALYADCRRALSNESEHHVDALQCVRRMLAGTPTIGQLTNDPLTLDELREMDGEPVWNDTTKEYALVDAGWWDGIGRAINSHGKYRLLDDRYYRRKPE